MLKICVSFADENISQVILYRTNYLFCVAADQEGKKGVRTPSPPPENQKAIGYLSNRVKSGNFGHQVNSDRDLVCFIF